MRFRLIAYSMLLGLILLCSAGSACVDGLRDGVSKGASTALSSIITVPVNNWLDEKFPKD